MSSDEQGKCCGNCRYYLGERCNWLEKHLSSRQFPSWFALSAPFMRETDGDSCAAHRHTKSIEKQVDHERSMLHCLFFGG